MAPVELVLAKLPDAKRNGRGWQARCPAHDDRRPSLSIAEGDGGRALLRCHAGCTTEEVVAAIGLRMADLMPESSAPVSTRGPVRKPAAHRSKVYESAAEAVAELERRHGRAVAQWTYQNAAGEPVGVVVRWNTSAGKDIRPLSRTPGGWIVGGMPEPRPLYRLPELLGRAGDRVYVCEGEPAADAALCVGLLATTSPHGSKSADKTDWRPLAGRDVVILPDNDAAGVKYAREVARFLLELDPSTRVGIVSLPGLPEKGDIVEFIEARGGMTPEAIRTEIEGLAAGTPELDAGEVIGGPVLTCLADVEPRPVPWLWPGRIPMGRITLLVGRPGEGKSFLTLDIAARVTMGASWPDGNGNAPSGTVILISAEDDPADTIRPRLDAHEADAHRVHLLATVCRIDEGGQAREVMFTLTDVAALETVLKRHPDCKLVVVDPIGSFLDGRTDAHRDNEVRSILAPVARLAEKHGPAVLVIAHRRKSGGTIADDLVLGSRGFTGIARAVWHLTRDPKDKNRRLLVPGKGNLAREGEGLAFSIGGEPARLRWERDPVRMTADDALAAEIDAERRRPGPEPETRKAAEEWLRDLLADGPMEAAEIKAEAGKAGYSWRTVHRAKDGLGIKPYREQFGGSWKWELPPCRDAGRDSQEPDHLATWHDSTDAPESEDSETPELPSCQVNEPGAKDVEIASFGQQPTLYESPDGRMETFVERAKRYHDGRRIDGYAPGVQPNDEEPGVG